MIARRFVSSILVSITIVLIRRYFVPLLTRTTGTWMGGVDSAGGAAETRRPAGGQG